MKEVLLLIWHLKRNMVMEVMQVWLYKQIGDLTILKNDGKVYQTSHLQKGKYKLTAHVYEYDGRGFIGLCCGL